MSVSPLLPDVGVIAIVPDVWGDVWMPRQQVLTRLARYFHVAWMDPPMEWREIIVRRTLDSAELNVSVSPIPGFYIVRPGRLLPHVHRPRFVGNALARLRVRQAEMTLRRAGAKRIILYLWRPEYSYAMDYVKADATCYHIDDEYSFSTKEIPISDEEAALIRRADDVIIHSPGLWEKKSHLAARPTFIPNGVNYASYATPVAEPADLKHIPHPRVGYIGVIKSFLNMPLLAEVARRNPEWSFVMVGPARKLGPDTDAFSELSRLPNVFLLGGRHVSTLPAYAQHLDVGIMPYDLDGYTHYIYPLKLHEYLAAGLPVVGTPIRTLADFSGVISLAGSADEWCAAIKRALGPATRAPDAVDARRKVAAAHDWKRITHRIALVLANAIGPNAAGIVAAAGDGDSASVDKERQGRSPVNSLRSHIPSRLKRPVRRMLNAVDTAMRMRALDRAVKTLRRHLNDGVLPAGFAEHICHAWGNRAFAADASYVAEVAQRAFSGTGPFLECGSGVTTLVCGIIATHRGIRLTALEQDHDWYLYMRGILDRFAVTNVDLTYAPLRPYDDYVWYDTDGASLPASFSHVFCDGPAVYAPDWVDPYEHNWRVGLVPQLQTRGVRIGEIVLDDADDPRCENSANRWRTLGVETRILSSKTGAFGIAKSLSP